MNAFPVPLGAVHKYGRIERRDAGGELQNVLHRLTARDEMLCRGVAIGALAEQVQFSLAAFEQPFAPIELLQSLPDGFAQALDFLTEARRLEVGANGFNLATPTVHVAADRRTMTFALPGADDQTAVTT
jgi:hypothetical protein